MKSAQLLFVSLLAVACGGPKNGGIKTPEERLNDQLAIAESQKDEQDQNLARYDEAETDTEKAAKFDKDAAKLTLQRAALNASDCPNTFEKSQLAGYTPGTAVVTLTFDNSGKSKDVMVSQPYAGTPVGDCIIRAMGTAAVEPYSDAEITTTWEVELKEAKPTDAKKK